MKKTYNIAYVPNTCKEKFIQLSRKFKTGYDYILGQNSIPHITIVQFNVKQGFDIEWLWNEIIYRIPLKEIILEFSDIKCKLENNWA